ncbi:MAG: hypothetical protein ABIS39_01205 [Sphingomicrobium sp.]
MDWGGPGFVIAIIAISTIGWVLTTFIRAKHGYPVEGEWGGKVDRGDSDTTKALAEENKTLHQTVEKLEARIKVLERIATEPGARLEDEIERLR